MKSYSDIDSYIQSQPEFIRDILSKIKTVIKNIAPDSAETISYGIPTFKQNGKNLVHFAGYKTHIGFYPGSQAIIDFQDEIKAYNTTKGTIQFKLDKPIPYDLIAKITEYRLDQLNK